MANTFKNYFLKNATIGANNAYATPAATQTTIIGMTIVSAGVTYFLVQNATISNGGALVPVGGDQKLVMEAGDYMQVQTSTANSADVIVSVLEIS